MAAPTESTFDVWLSEKLQNINPEVDLEVFVSYIRGILETDTSTDDKVESISGIMAEITDSINLESHCEEILKRWEVLEGENADNNADKPTLEDRMHQIIETQQTKVVKTSKAMSDEAKARKAAILAQYAQFSDGENSDSEERPAAAAATGDGGGAAKLGDLFQNINSLSIDQAEKEKREKQKADSEKKKQKDKEDREKQKQKTQDRKEAEKKRTQKGERRR